MCSIREIVDIDIRSPDCDRLKAVYEACKLLADVYAYMHTWKDNAENSEFLQHITEMSYFLIIFLKNSNSKYVLHQFQEIFKLGWSD